MQFALSDSSALVLSDIVGTQRHAGPIKLPTHSQYFPANTKSAFTIFFPEKRLNRPKIAPRKLIFGTLSRSCDFRTIFDLKLDNFDDQEIIFDRKPSKKNNYFCGVVSTGVVAAQTTRKSQNWVIKGTNRLHELQAAILGGRNFNHRTTHLVILTLNTNRRLRSSHEGHGPKTLKRPY